MADVAEAAIAPAEMPNEIPGEIPGETPNAASDPITFGGTTRNLVPGMAMLLAGMLAFVMNMTDVFFAEAIAWTFIIWGALLIYAGLLDIYETFEVTDDALIIRNAVRPWNSYKAWDWDNISRLEIIVGRKDSRPANAKMQVYHTAAGELGLEREDRALDPELAELIIKRAELSPASPDNPQNVHELPLEQNATYTWQ